jgi:hypothetical protein
LASGAGGDPLVAAAVGSLPPHLAEGGTATRPQLFERFDSLKKGARDLALLPAGAPPPGPLTRALARLASKIRIQETPGG